MKYAVRYVIGRAAASSKVILSGITKHALAGIQVYSDQAPSVVKQPTREPTYTDQGQQTTIINISHG